MKAQKRLSGPDSYLDSVEEPRNDDHLWLGVKPSSEVAAASGGQEQHADVHLWLRIRVGFLPSGPMANSGE
jgi:hypothetical protein